MIQTYFELDSGTTKAIRELRGVFGVKTSTGVIRKAIALSRIAARRMNKKDHTITLLDAKKRRIKVSLTT